MSRTTPVIRAVLFDADGVVQQSKPDWLDEVKRLCGNSDHVDQFVQDVFKAKEPSLRGVGDFAEALEAVLQKWGSPATAGEALKVWTMIEPNDAALALVRQLRHRGTTVALATNQQSHRANFMLNELGYIDQFDHILCSCFIGHAKPGVEYFHKCGDILGLSANEMLFIDDHDRNVESARMAGLQSQRFHLDDGLDALRGILDRYELLTG